MMVMMMVMGGCCLMTIPPLLLLLDCVELECCVEVSLLLLVSYYDEL